MGLTPVLAAYSQYVYMLGGFEPPPPPPEANSIFYIPFWPALDHFDPILEGLRFNPICIYDCGIVA